MCGVQKRKYRGGKFGVNIGTSVPPRVFDDIESLASQLGVTKSEVLRRLVTRGLAECQRDGRLPALVATSPDGPASSFSSDVHAEEEASMKMLR